MNTLRYKDYAIIAAAKRDLTTGKYKPLVHIAWQTLAGRRKLSFSLPERCATFQEASALALGAAKKWTDNQPEPPGAGAVSASRGESQVCADRKRAVQTRETDPSSTQVEPEFFFPQPANSEISV